MLKHQLVVATLAFVTLTFSESAVRAAAVLPIDLPHPSTTAPVRFGGGGHGFGGGGFGHFGGGFGRFGGGGFGHFGGFGFRHFGFAPRRAFVGRFYRPLFVHRFHRPVFFVHRFHRPVFFRPFRRRVFVRRAFFFGAPVYGYSAGCAWLRHRALITGAPYWWRRYRWCVGW
jgi:hypothetical protein